MERQIITKKRYYLLFAIYFLAFGIIVALLTSFINYQVRYTDIEKQLQTRAVAESHSKRQYIKDYVSQIEMLLLSIANNDLSKKYIETGNEDDRENLNSLFYSLTYSNKDLMQLRFIDTQGFEKVRIDRDKKSPALMIIPADKMQNKANRYYFKEASQIINNAFWHSNIDLNVEHGQIEVPYKPTFRVATPLILNNKFQGILIANVIMDNLLDVLTTSQNFHIYLIDKDGEIIVNPEPDLSWSRYLENKPKIHKIFPNRYKELLSNSSISKQGLYMFSYADMFRNREGMRILMVPKSEIISKLKMSNVVTALLIAGIVLIVSVPLSWLASFIPSKLQATIVDAYDEIKKYTNIIDRNIATSQTDKNGVITDISSKFLEITGYQKHEVIGKNHNFLKHPETPAEHYKDMWNTISRGTVWTGEMQDLSKSGQEFWISQIITPEINHKGEIIAYTSVAQDITARKIIEKMSVTDSLTGLYNRRKIDAILSAEINRFNRYNTEFCVLLLDIDFFKKVNDNFGHQVGDDVLVNVSEILQKSIRGTDFAGRWGGEEFLIVAVQIDLQNATILAEKIRSTIEETQFNIVDHITISIGVACYQFGETVTLFLNRADEALYEAKESGRNKVIAAKGEKEV